MPGKLRQRTLEYLREVLMEGPGKLSHREAEICAGIIMGYSTEAIGLNCMISVNTVATHRKRAYAKLGISSQNELFLRYFSAVRRFQSDLEE
ncbi:helix-turn-helix transcriptional regulator [Novosphingobium colocasiae]|nr:helix-turn-helix transcriptional regulator [Novosphingobium colocasiae]